MFTCSALFPSISYLFIPSTSHRLRHLQETPILFETCPLTSNLNNKTLSRTNLSFYTNGYYFKILKFSIKFENFEANFENAKTAMRFVAAWCVVVEADSRREAMLACGIRGRTCSYVMSKVCPFFCSIFLANLLLQKRGFSMLLVLHFNRYVWRIYTCIHFNINTHSLHTFILYTPY